jgi:hypothetical protein
LCTFPASEPEREGEVEGVMEVERVMEEEDEEDTGEAVVGVEWLVAVVGVVGGVEARESERGLAAAALVSSSVLL